MQKIMNGHLTKARGFTLIELLVVIAIIGILAGIVLASLGTVRQKGGDAGVSGNLDGLRTQGEVFAQNNGANGYTGFCTTANGGATTALAAAKQDAGVTTATNANTVVGASLTATCHDSTTAWAAEVPLKSVTTQFWCVDSNGFSGTTTTFSLTTGTDTACN